MLHNLPLPQGKACPEPCRRGKGEGNNKAQQIGFQVAAYDTAQPLVIDPVLVYSTYFGGNGSDSANGIAVDNEGNAYVIGTTYSSDFPTINPNYTELRGSNDAFVVKFSADGSTVMYSTYLGGSQSVVSFGDSGINDEGNGIAVDHLGNVYVTGGTQSADFPTVNAKYPNLQGDHDIFVTKINSNGSQILYSTYLGGSNFSDDGYFETGKSIAVDGTGNAIVTGSTMSTDFPVINAKYPNYAGGQMDAFVTKFSPTGSELLYSTYLGGNRGEQINSIAVDGTGNTYITGWTNSGNFPTFNAKYPYWQGGWPDAFVTKFSSDGQSLGYSTYLGGSHWDNGFGIAVDSAGNAYVTGTTQSSNFPTINAKYPSLKGGSDAFVTKFSADGTNVLYSTYLGGTSEESGSGIAVDNNRNAYITGQTISIDFPAVNAKYLTLRGVSDAFVTKLSADGLTSLYSTYIGGAGNEEGKDIVADNAGNLYVVGLTESSDFPTNATDASINSFDSSFNGGNIDAFVTKLATDDTDGDALLDSWETDGIDFDNDGNVDLDLPAMGADPLHKDIFIEIDYMVKGGIFGHSHKPKAESLQIVIDSFNNAPVSNPDGTTGIHLHIDAGSETIMNPVTHETWGARRPIKCTNAPNQPWQLRSVRLRLECF